MEAWSKAWNKHMGAQCQVSGSQEQRQSIDLVVGLLFSSLRIDKVRLGLRDFGKRPFGGGAAIWISAGLQHALTAAFFCHLCCSDVPFPDPLCFAA